MGIDFIRRTSGKPYEKRWREGRDRTKEPSLVDIRLTEGQRSLTAELAAPGSGCAGATVIVQVAGSDLIVSDGLTSIGRVRRAPADVVSTLSAQHGIASATVERVGTFGTIEIRLTK